MKIIVCVSENFGIGNNGNLLFSLAPDMKFFRETTSGKVVVMGRNTLDSFPGGKPLKNRVNVVLTRDKNFSREGVYVVHSKEEALSFLGQYNSDDIFIIGGAQIYEMFRDTCDEALVTKVFKKADCDTFLFNIDADKNWKLSSQSDVFEYEGLKYSFCKYVRI